MRKALEDGYHIVHKGLLCWMEIPTPSMVPALRVLLTALEAVFTFSLWAIRGKTGYGMECEVSVGGLLNHCHSRGYVRIAPLSSFLLVVKLPSLQKNWRRRLWLMSIVIGYSASGDYAKILKGAHEMKKRNIYVDSHPGAADQADKRSIAKAVKEKKHTCDVCQHSFTKKNILRRRLCGRKHANKVAALGEAPLLEEN